jgi:hypothetical protein
MYNAYISSFAKLNLTVVFLLFRILINNPYFMLQATLTSADGTQDLISLTDNTTGTLLGDTVSSLYPLRDLVNMEGAYFCFANLSVRLEGQYRLKYHLMEMTPEGVQYRTSIYSEPFQVYPPKLFPGVEESTLTSLKYANMGLKLRVRKETRAKKIKLDPQYESEQSNFTPSASSTASSPLHSVATPEPLSEQQSPMVVKHKMSLSFILSCGDNNETINEPKAASMGNYFHQYQPSTVNQGELNYYYN